MTDVIDFQKFRADRSDTGKRRLLHVAALLELFKQAHGRPAATMAEVHAWADARNLQRPIDPFQVLTADQIKDYLRENDE